MWFKTTTTSNQALFDSGAPGSYSDFQIFTVGNGGISFGGSPPSDPGGLYLAFWANDIYVPIGVGAVADGNWHFIAASYNASNQKAAVYFDGNLSSAYFWTGSKWIALQPQPIVMTGTMNTVQNPILIGSARTQVWSYGNAYFTGLIDDVNISGNTAISSAEIKRMYAEGLAKHLAFSNP